MPGQQPVDELAWVPVSNHRLWIARAINTQEVVSQRAASLKIDMFIEDDTSGKSDLENPDRRRQRSER